MAHARRSSTLRRPLVALLAGALCTLSPLQAQPAGPAQPGPVSIGGVEYKKLETREATEQRMVSLLRPGRPVWGEWYRLTPFPYDNVRGPKLAAPQGPEADIAKLRHGGPGPDLKAEYEGKGGRKITWESVGHAAGTVIKFDIYKERDLNEFASGYLYTTVTVDRPTTIDVTMGSDDALRFWLNGRLLVDAEVLRGLDPESDKVRLDLQPGVNHILAKVGQVRGGYEYQVLHETPLPAQLIALLDYQLNLDFPTSDEDRYYRAYTVPTPPDVVLEVGGLDVLPPDRNGQLRPIVSTRRGDVYIVEGAYDVPPHKASFKKFATGMHEPLGLAVRMEPGPDGAPRAAVYCVQRGELTRLIDSDGDDVADIYETVSDAWGVSGNYHEFAFGPKFDSRGNAWVTLNVGFCNALGKSIAKWRGCAITVGPGGAAQWVCDGLRSPNGIGEYSDGSMFYLDNQGDYVGTNRMSLMTPGSWHGHPSSLHWRTDWKKGDPEPERQQASIWFPYKKMGQSTADFLLYGGKSQHEAVNQSVAAAKFGPFEGQVFVGDQTLCTVMRVDLEKVDGFYQGVCFPFRSGLDCGVNRLAWGGDGSMFVGQTDRGWGSIGRLRYGLQRIAWTGEVPFEVRTMHATSDGFELTFTQDIDAAAAGNPASYGMVSYTYEYHPEYGSAEMETARQKVVAAKVVGPRTVRLQVETLRGGGMGYVHELTLPGVRDAQGRGLLHAVAYYTMQKIPGRAGADASR